MNESSFLLIRVIRANDGGFRHEKHEGSIRPRVSCMPSCTELTELRRIKAMNCRGRVGSKTLTISMVQSQRMD
jgi:hypothetical protein